MQDEEDVKVEESTPVEARCQAVHPGQTCPNCGYNSEDVRFITAVHERLP